MRDVFKVEIEAQQAYEEAARGLRAVCCEAVPMRPGADPTEVARVRHALADHVDIYEVHASELVGRTSCIPDQPVMWLDEVSAAADALSELARFADCRAAGVVVQAHAAALWPLLMAWCDARRARERAGDEADRDDAGATAWGADARRDGGAA